VWAEIADINQTSTQLGACRTPPRLRRVKGTVAERRTVLKVLTGCAGATVAAVGAATTGAFVAQSERRAGSASGSSWRRVTRIDALEQGKPTRAAVIGAVEDAWVRAPDRRIGSVWLVRDGDRAVRAYSAICPHLGCSIDAQEDRFVCKCHDSHFSAQGAVLDGPSPRGMDPLEARVTEGWVEVRYKRFKLGTAARVEG
jgi:menaquinol-cytochrome c reductase iron-sulfur subunit